jgi:hypothetical protein
MTGQKCHPAPRKIKAISHNGYIQQVVEKSPIPSLEKNRPLASLLAKEPRFLRKKGKYNKLVADGYFEVFCEASD